MYDIATSLHCIGVLVAEVVIVEAKTILAVLSVIRLIPTSAVKRILLPALKRSVR